IQPRVNGYISTRLGMSVCAVGRDVTVRPIPRNRSRDRHHRAGCGASACGRGSRNTCCLSNFRQPRLPPVAYTGWGVSLSREGCGKMGTLHAATFAALLRRFRRATGMTQAELAERAGLSPEAISALERGVNRTPRRETVELLAEALGLEDA